MTISVGVQLEQQNALKDASDYIDERGNDIIIYVNTESGITRDKFGSIKKRVPTSYTFHAYPITFNPTDDELKKAGLKEKVDIAVTLATKDLTDQSLTFEMIDHIRWECEFDGNRYTIKDKGQINHFSHVYLNVTLGLFRK